ncbi:amino acid transporter [Glutamicibacter sp.]|uniref:amino acid transporter n=1 Tax=Glutamicibacter sp. TaxID=1931995 RepID=UPI0028BEFBBC|nr:amino acid transporter [Glutamicibacter sp.]
MCLSGLDYFSTLGYQPAIAALAAGALAPFATLILVAVTLGAALPVYRRVAGESPHGQGSIAMLERLLPHWKGKLLVLVLLGFAATDFMITATLSAADASAHLIENPFTPEWFTGKQIPITVILLLLLGALFLRGFNEVIWIAVALVGVFLSLNLIVIIVSLLNISANPVTLSNWMDSLFAAHGDPLMMLLVCLIVFPKLALGLSGFETGVAVMPQIASKPGDTPENPASRIRGARKLLTTAALIMSGFLVLSSVVTTVLIPAGEFQDGGSANGRALSWLAHKLLGDGFGTLYDVSTILILWFAGASALAGLLNLIPRYLPRFGMAPEWARAVRPLVLVVISVALAITWHFEADVDAQGAAYATGVLVLMSSAAVAVTISARRKRERGKTVLFTIVSVVFLYTTVANCLERPEGLKIAAFFIAAVLLVSLISRFRRSTELRATSVSFNAHAEELIKAAGHRGILQLIAHEPANTTKGRYRKKLHHASLASHISDKAPVMFLEVKVSDYSDFAQDIHVRGVVRHGFWILEATAPSVPTAIASVSLAIRDNYSIMPHIYFRWTEGNPLSNLAKFVFLGQGEIAPLTREVLREAEPDLQKRPWVHVG